MYVTELAGSSVNLTVFFWAESQQANVLKVSDQVATGIKLALDKAGIDMPFPHTVVLLEKQPEEPDGPAVTTRPPLKKKDKETEPRNGQTDKERVNR